MSIGRLSLGTAQLGMPYRIAGRAAVLSEGQVTAILQAAVDLGIGCLDTAPQYGLAEQRIGAFLRDHDLYDEISICTRLPSLNAIETGRVEQQVEDRLTASLRRLGSDCIDSYLVADTRDLLTHGDALVGALVGQRDKGRVVDIGVSLYELDAMTIVEDYPELNVVQHPFNLLDRRLLEGDWPNWLAAKGAKLQIRNVLLQGLLAAEPDALPAGMPDARAALQSLRRVVEPYDAMLPALAIAFAFSLDTDRVVIGVDSPAQLEEVAAAAERTFPEPLLEALATELGTAARSVIDPRAWPASGA